MKYYFLSIVAYQEGISYPMFASEAITTHPFNFISGKNIEKLRGRIYSLVNWKEITEEEFKLYKSLENTV